MRVSRRPFAEIAALGVRERHLPIRPGGVWWTLERDGRIVSFLNAAALSGGAVKLKTNYTVADCRRRGYFGLLLGSVIAAYAGRTLRADCLDTSLSIYLRAGFYIVRERQFKQFHITYVTKPPPPPV